MAWPGVRPRPPSGQARPTSAAWAPGSGAKPSAWPGAAASGPSAAPRAAAAAVPVKRPQPRPAGVPPFAEPNAGSVAANVSEVLIVSSMDPDKEQIGVKTLLGEYLESGTNHGRKVFKRKPLPEQEHVDVWMYFWDTRDGVSFSGWWFGNELGGSKVWSHCASDSQTPPQSGWKVPWDGPVRNTMIVESQSSIAASVSGGGSLQGALTQTAQSAKKAVDAVRAMIGNDYTSYEALEAAEGMLKGHPEALMDALKRLSDALRNAAPDQKGQLQTLGALVRSSQGQVNQEMLKLKAAKSKCSHTPSSQQAVPASVANPAAEERDEGVLDEILPETTDRANSAEDAVEKACITAEMIEAAGEDIDAAREAVQHTEQATMEAQKLVGEARIFLNARLAQCRRLESESVRQRAMNAIGQLSSQLQEAQSKLNPLKTVRQEFSQRAAAQLIMQETLERLSPAEVLVDRAVEATMMISSDEGNIELIKTAEIAADRAAQGLDGVMAFVSGKRASAKGSDSVLDQIFKLEARCRTSHDRLSDLRKQHKEASERCISEMILTEATEKLKAVVECVQKAADAENPFIMGMEELPLEQTLEAVKACDNSTTLASTACSVARMFLATKIVEARRMVDDVGSKTQAKLKEFQSELEHQMKKLGDIKKSTATRKRDATMREAQSEVAKAEQLVAVVGEAARLLTDDSKLLELSAQEIRVAADETAKAEQAALAAVSAARKFITARQIESKGKDVSTEVSAELIQLQTRLTEAQSNITKHKKLCGNLETRLATKKVIEEANAKVQDWEEKIQKLSEAVEQLSTKQDAEDPEAPKKITKAADEVSAEAQVAARSTHRWFESHKGAQGMAKDELERLRPRIKDAQDKLDATIKAYKEASEKISIEQIVKDSEEQIKEAEASFEKVTAAEMPFLKGMEDLPDAAKLLEDLEVAVTDCHTALNAAKTTLAVKRLAAKRLSAGSAASTLQVLESLQQRFETVMKNVTSAKHGITERKVATVRRHGEDKLTTAEQKVAEASEATKALADIIDLATADMKSLCEKAGVVQAAASAFVSETKNFLQQQQRDIKLITADAAMHGDLHKLLDKLVTIQADLDKQKAILRDQEHKFVAERLLKDAKEWIDSLDAKLKSTVELAAPLTDEAGGLTNLYFSQVTTAMKKHMKSHSKTVAALFEEIGEKAPIAEAKFVDFCLSKLLELQENKDKTMAEGQVKLAFKRIDTKGFGEVVEADFNEHFRERWVVATAVAMTDVMEVKGVGKTVRKLDPNEILEQLEEPVKEDSVGLLRVKVKAEQDEKEGYVTMESNAGTTYLNPYDPFMAVEAKVQQALQELLEMGAKASKYIEAKSEELKSVREGPLAETRTALQGMEPLVRKVQQERKKLKTCIAETKKKQVVAIENEKRKQQEAVEREEADRVLAEAMKPAVEAEEQLEKVVAAAQVLVTSRGKDTENPLQAMDEAEKALNSSLKQVEVALTVIKRCMDDMNSVGKGPLAETRSALVKLKIKVGAFETKCKRQLAALAGARKQVTQDAEEVLQEALRDHAISQALQPGELFKRLCGDAEAVSPAALRSLLEGIPNSTMKPCQLDLGVEGLAASISKLTLLDMLQEYQRCVKETAISTVFEVKDSKTVRKMVLGEIVEVLEKKKGEGDSGLDRARCRAVKDSKEGWATMKGNQGTSFLEKCPKPYLYCEEDVKLQESFASSSGIAGTFEKAEVLELIEGPREEEALESLRVKGKAARDDKVGWVTLKDLQGKESMQKEKVLICLRSIAFTSTFDIAEGKALRKLDVGEALELVEGPQDDTARGLTRAKARAKIDGREGWITLKGNQGTAYAEESDKNYIITASVPLEKRLKSGDEAIRSLDVGEVFEVLEGPEKETHEGAKRARARSIRSGLEGWISMTKTIREWAPRYKCTQSTVLNDILPVKDAKVVRKLEAGEIVEALDLPIVESASGFLRIRARAAKDGATGWVTIRGNMGTEVMKPMVDGQENEASSSKAQPEQQKEKTVQSEHKEDDIDRSLQDDVEKFLLENGIDERASKVMRKAKPELQRAVMNQGGLKDARNPSLVLTVRMRELSGPPSAHASRRASPPPGPQADQSEQNEDDIDRSSLQDDVEKFLLENGIDDRASEFMRRAKPELQRAAMNQHSLKDTKNPSSVLMARMRVLSGPPSGQASRHASPPPWTQADQSEQKEDDIDRSSLQEDVEKFLLKNGIDDRASEFMRKAKPELQRAAMNQHSLKDTKNPSSVLTARIKVLRGPPSGQASRHASPPPEPQADQWTSSGGTSGRGGEREREPRRDGLHERQEYRDPRYERRDGYERPAERRDAYERRDGYERPAERRDAFERRDAYERRDGYERQDRYDRRDKGNERNDRPYDRFDRNDRRR